MSTVEQDLSDITRVASRDAKRPKAAAYSKPLNGREMGNFFGSLYDWSRGDTRNRALLLALRKHNGRHAHLRFYREGGRNRIEATNAKSGTTQGLEEHQRCLDEIVGTIPDCVFCGMVVMAEAQTFVKPNASVEAGYDAVSLTKTLGQLWRADAMAQERHPPFQPFFHAFDILVLRRNEETGRERYGTEFDWHGDVMTLLERIFRDCPLIKPAEPEGEYVMIGENRVKSRQGHSTWSLPEFMAHLRTRSNQLGWEGVVLYRNKLSCKGKLSETLLYQGERSNYCLKVKKEYSLYGLAQLAEDGQQIILYAARFAGSNPERVGTVDIMSDRWAKDMAPCQLYVAKIRAAFCSREHKFIGAKSPFLQSPRVCYPTLSAAKLPLERLNGPVCSVADVCSGISNYEHCQRGAQRMRDMTEAMRGYGMARNSLIADQPTKASSGPVSPFLLQISGAAQGAFRDFVAAKARYEGVSGKPRPLVRKCEANEEGLVYTDGLTQEEVARRKRQRRDWPVEVRVEVSKVNQSLLEEWNAGRPSPLTNEMTDKAFGYWLFDDESTAIVNFWAQ